MLKLKVFSLVGAAAGLALVALGTANCGSDCTKTLTCGGPDDDPPVGGGSNVGGSTSSGGEGGIGGDPGVGGHPGVGGAGGGPGSGGSGGTGGTAPVVPVQVAAGSSQTCAAFSDGAAKCWGSNSRGQLGDGTTTDSTLPTIVGLDDVLQIDSGFEHTCALRADGTVWCVGRNNHGQLGNGTNVDSTSFVQVSGITNATQISATTGTSCARLADATARCWGQGTSGSLGNGSTSSSSVPVPFSATNVVQIATGGNVTCARIGNGTVRCAGQGVGGQLGNGSENDSATPVLVSGVSNADDLATGTGHSCIVRGTGEVACWGADTMGQIGDGTAGAGQLTPVNVPGVSGAVDVSVYTQTSCVVLNDGTARCWGRNSAGQLGNGTTSGNSPNPSPVQVLGLSGAQTIAVGTNHVCALTANDQAYCWGSNNSGQLGNGNTTNSSQPVLVSGL